MSQINFANLTSRFPDQTSVWERLARYFADHRQRTEVAVRWLREESDTDTTRISAGDFATAFTLLIESGKAREYFRVAAPDGTLVGGKYATTDDIPKSVPSRDYSHYYPLEELDVVPVYELTE